MPKYLSVVLMAASSALFAALSSTAFLATSQQTKTTQAPVPKIKQVPIQPTSAVSGQEMYTTYCAVCHGANGKGSGPAAPAMKTAPTDLTLLSSKNGGKFPDAHVASVLSFGTATPAHGTSDMPIWGDLMRTLHRGTMSETVVHQRISNITDYLKQIQQ